MSSRNTPPIDDRMYRTLVESTNSFVFSLDAAGCFDYVNRFWSRKVGYSPHEIIGTKGIALIESACVAPVQRHLDRALDGVLVEDVEFQSKTKQGDLIDVLVNLAPVFDASGKVIRILGTGTDITRRRRAEKALRRAHAGLEQQVKARTKALEDAITQLNVEIQQRNQVEKALRNSQAQLKKSEKQYRTLVDTSLVGIYRTDLNGRILYANDALKTMFGYQSADMLSTDGVIGLYKHPRQRQQLIKTLKHTGKADNVEVEFTGNGGKPITALMCARLDGDRIAGVLIDITLRKAAEKEQQQVGRQLKKALDALERKAHDLEAANAELDQYASVVSHDLKTPLRAIHNYTDFLTEDVGPHADSDVKQYLDGLGKAVRQCEQLVDDLLYLSRIGRTTTHVEPIDLNRLLTDIRDHMALDANTTIHLPADFPMVTSIPLLLRQIFQNLIHNAVKFNRSEIKQVALSWKSVGHDGIEICVRDNGIGILPQYQEQIFGAFQRLHTQKEYEGTGIGLAIVKKAIEMVGGSVSVESSTAHGSAFCVRLPATGVTRDKHD